MKFSAQPEKRADRKGAREMAAAAAAEITFGVPVNLEFGEAFVDLGAENRDGQRIVVLAVDDGEDCAHLELSPGQVELLADVLRGLAQVGG
jgi:hypothetical protein